MGKRAQYLHAACERLAKIEEDRYSVRAWATAEDACDDVEVLLRENAKLQAVAEAARAAVDMVDEEEPRDALRRALAALEAP